MSLRACLAWLRTHRARQAERAALAALLDAGDHVLNDIGIGRHELAEMLRRL